MEFCVVTADWTEVKKVWLVLLLMTMRVFPLAEKVWMILMTD